ncbi:RagB/SusD family nutrient uptake outer membrane protein [Mucilaginibacter paludis]|uniref:RagB/SusD domain-containing protein n=1 Tax=Mucilaginibacter paludis DSM 18603 TaxID=714943 RepID=H1Y740_9SPHI|nr:RagB/SusD family nutrient uptake outer membrane protein [Mucilaginibacter paludis]EHQ28659.1 hypothetical protein, secreted [Mucilaginibacter paludis DSM 18603]
MKRKLNYKYIILTLSFIVTSCKLDQVNPNAATDLVILNTRSGIIALSIGLRQYYSTTGLSNVMLAPDVTARELKGVATFTNTLELEAGGTALSTTNGIILAYWTAMQTEMGMCESIIKSAPTASGVEPALLSGVMAQAYLFKAMSLAELAIAFEQANLATSITDPAKFVPRAQVFAEAIRLLDLGIATITATPPSTAFTTSVTGTDFDLKNTLYAMEARINLMAGNYQKAIDNANLVDLAKTSKFTYTTASPNPLYTLYNVTISYRARDNFGLPAGLYDVGDLRYNFYFTTPKTVINGDPVVSMAGFTTSPTAYIPVYLTDEIKLIKAEAIVRLGGDTNPAVDLINAVRTQTTGDPFGVNAGLSAYSGATTTDALLVEIYKQRCEELYLSGLKWEDTRRFNRPAPPANNTERNRIFYPYPTQERNVNPNTPVDPAI